MAWFLFLLAVAALVAALFANAIAVGLACMLASLALAVIATMTLMTAHANAAARHSS
ncbi:MAG: hypothetical protein JSR34_09675 [Proteobacteria bacterium]|nr:hypothetical protein [Pseudomonadota bacterium]